MQCGREVEFTLRRDSQKRAFNALIMILTMVFSSFIGIVSLPSTSANADGDVAIISGVNPLPNVNYSQWDSFQPSVIIQNIGVLATSSKAIKWTTCSGDQISTACGNGGSTKDGTTSIPALYSGETAQINFTSPFEYYNKPGIYTIVFRFLVEDDGPSNDILAYTFNLAEYFMDLDVDADWDVRPGHHNYASEDGEWLYNTGRDYPLYFKGIISSCTTNCDLQFEAGWRLFDDENNLVANDSKFISNPGGEWGTESFNLSLPALNSSQEGDFTLEYGVLNSSSDMNAHNNLANTTVRFSDDIDLIVDKMYPAYKPDSPDYFYGEDSIEVAIKNNGHTSIMNTSITMELFSINLESEAGPFNCENLTIHPGDSALCNFDLFGQGSKVIRIIIPSSFTEGADDKPSDNSLTETVNIISGDIFPTVSQDNEMRTYNTGQNITLRAHVSSTAAKPLNYSWYLAGVIPWSYGQTAVFSAGDIGMGEHMFMLKVEDALGNLASTYTHMTVYNRTLLNQDPWLEGEAVTLTPARVEAMHALPEIGLNYNLQSGLDALMVFDINVLSTDPTNNDTGMEEMIVDLNLSALIPDSINRSSLNLYDLESATSTNWQQLGESDSFTIVDNETARAILSKSGAYLIIGVIPQIEVFPGAVEIELLPGGYLNLSWQPYGDLDNIYLSGWRIYRNTMPKATNIPFPMVDTVDSASTWELLVTGASMIELNPYDSYWADPKPLPSGICATYLIAPVDRQAIPDFFHGNVSNIQNNSGILSPALACGDSEPPMTEVVNLQHTVTFTNDSECWSWFFDWSRCYVVNLTWTWPQSGPNDAESYNLYRLESRPENTDLRLTQPLYSNLTFVDGENGYYEQFGWLPEGPQPYLTYYYILAPVDEVGNVMYLQTYGQTENIERVHVDDQYWKYREYLVPEPPPPPEPPYGVEYLGTVEDFLQDESFQIAGMTFLVLLCLNLIGLPLLRRRVKSFKRKMGVYSGDDADDEFADDFAEFFS